LVVGEAIGDD